MSDVLHKSEADMVAPSSYQELESALLDGVAAIRCLTTERDRLRSKVEAQEHELMTLQATTKDLRRQLVLIGDCYMKFATSCVTQLQYVGQAMQHADVRETVPADLRRTQV